MYIKGVKQKNKHNLQSNSLKQKFPAAKDKSFTVNRHLEDHATLKEAVQGRIDTTETTIFGIDIDHLKRNIDLLKYSLDYAEAIVNTVREPLVILNRDLQVITANKAFYQTFGLLPEKLENRPFSEHSAG